MASTGYAITKGYWYSDLFEQAQTFGCTATQKLTNTQSEDSNDNFKLISYCFSSVWSVSETFEILYVTDIIYILLSQSHISSETVNQ